MSAGSPRFERLAVLGLGLIGGSVALAARRRGLVGSVVAAGRHPDDLAGALAIGLVDEVASPEQAVRGADIVLLATPVGSMSAVLREALPGLAAGSLVTDAGSVKGPLADTLPGLLPSGSHYVGAHPMAGSHRRGVEYARADLFEGCACAICPLPDADPRAVERVAGFWRGLGARVVRRSPEAHDAEVAWTSHLPHLLAFSFARASAAAPDAAGELVGRGFADFTRIARSESALWSDILCANRKALEGPLQRFRESADELLKCLQAEESDSLETFLDAARQALSRLTDNPSGDRDPEGKAAPRGSGPLQE